MESLRSLTEQFNIPEIKERDYWFVRTEGGTYFDDFYNNKYIAIGWDYLTPQLMEKDAEDKIDEVSIRNLIAQKEGEQIEPLYTDEEFKNLSPEDQAIEKDRLKSSRKQVSGIYNKVYKFLYELKPNDIVIIPSKNSDNVAIGAIRDDVSVNEDYITEFEQRLDRPEYEPCPYLKRRTVYWYGKFSHSSLDIYLQKALKPQQAITSLKDYAPFINRSIHTIYSQGEYIHSVFKTCQDGDLTLAQLSDFTAAFMSQLQIANENQGTNLSADDIKIKVNIHCPGMIEMIGVGIAAAFTILGFIGCYILNTHGGKSFVKTAGGNEFGFETKGKEGNAIENRKLDIENRKLELEERRLDLKEKELSLIEWSLGNPDFKEKLDSLASLNLQVPQIYQIEEKEIEKAE